jgi:hypothetical protein
MSRAAVRMEKGVRHEQPKLEERGIIVQADSRDGIMKELPEGYKMSMK